MTLRDDVLEILTANILEERVEGEAHRQDLPDKAVNNASTESLKAFIRVFEGLSSQVPESHYRTRGTDRNATHGYGIEFYTRPTNVRGRLRIQSVLLPTRERFGGQIEAYLAGHSESPLTAIPRECTRRRDGFAYGYVEPPTELLVREMVSAFQNSALFSKIERG